MIALFLGDCSFFSAVYSRSLWIEHAPYPPYPPYPPAWSGEDEIRYNPGMKNLVWSSIVLPLVLAVAALPGSAKTKLELKDAQGKVVGTVLVWEQGSGVGLQLTLHVLPPGDHALHFLQIS